MTGRGVTTGREGAARQTQRTQRPRAALAAHVAHASRAWYILFINTNVTQAGIGIIGLK